MEWVARIGGLNYSLAVRSILLIRHGETVGNAARVVQHPDDPLSPRGIAQAERLARRLASEGVSAIVSSDYARARGTAERLQQLTGAPLLFEPLLQERNFGDLRGTPYSEIGFDMFGLDYAPPNGESWPVFHARVDRAWARVQEHLSATAGGRLAVVTHGLVCRSLAARTYTDIRRWTTMPRGGHFAALEQPEALAREMLEFFSALQ